MNKEMMLLLIRIGVPLSMAAHRGVDKPPQDGLINLVLTGTHHVTIFRRVLGAMAEASPLFTSNSKHKYPNEKKPR